MVVTLQPFHSPLPVGQYVWWRRSRPGEKHNYRPHLEPNFIHPARSQTVPQAEVSGQFQSSAVHPAQSPVIFWYVAVWVLILVCNGVSECLTPNVNRTSIFSPQWVITAIYHQWCIYVCILPVVSVVSIFNRLLSGRSGVWIPWGAREKHPDRP